MLNLKTVPEIHVLIADNANLIYADMLRSIMFLHLHFLQNLKCQLDCRSIRSPAGHRNMHFLSDLYSLLSMSQDHSLRREYIIYRVRTGLSTLIVHANRYYQNVILVT